MSEATRYNIINLNIRLNSMVDQKDLTLSLTVRMKRSLSGTCYLLDAQFRFMPRVVTSLLNCSNSQSACICVILNPRCRYNLCTCMIPSEMFSIFQFLIILPLENMMCHYMLLRKPIPLMCMRSQQIMTSFYLSRC